MLACRSLLQCPQQGGAGLSCWLYTCLVFTVRFLESSSRTPSTSARSHQRASRGEGPCACSLYYFLKCHSLWSRGPRQARFWLVGVEVSVHGFRGCGKTLCQA